MKKSPMPLRGGTYVVTDGVLTRDDDAPAESSAADAADTPRQAAPLRPRAATPKPKSRAGSPARKR